MRASRFDDYIEAMKKVWAGDVVEHKSDFLNWTGFKSYPLPKQTPFPVVIGGSKGKAFQRVARFGQGWFAPTPVVEKLDPGQGFAWHIDSGPVGTARRFLSALTYLNNVDEGGFTEFPLQNTKLKPEQGMIVLFPPYWMFPHRGAPPTKETKYKMTCYFMVPERESFYL